MLYIYFIPIQTHQILLKFVWIASYSCEIRWSRLKRHECRLSVTTQFGYIQPVIVQERHAIREGSANEPYT